MLGYDANAGNWSDRLSRFGLFAAPQEYAETFCIGEASSFQRVRRILRTLRNWPAICDEVYEVRINELSIAALPHIWHSRVDRRAVT
jgi:hypothetical protein